MKTAHYILVFLFFSLLACQKELPELTDGLADCDCAKYVTADFSIEEMTADFPSQVWNFFTETDTIWQNKNVCLKVKDTNAVDVKWYLGTDVEYGSEVFRHFNSTLAGGVYPVTCVVRKKPNKICLPNDDGYDSITKYIAVSAHNQRDSSYLLEGDFRVLRKNIEDSIDIQILIDKNQFYDLRMKIVNYNGIGDTLEAASSTNEYDNNYREMYLSLFGYGPLRIHYDLNGILKMKIYIGSTSGPYYSFTGRKI